MKIFSFGGGVQSTAALVLAAQGELDVDAFLFANVGDDSEHPDTLRYVRQVAMPYAERHGIRLTELHRVRRRLMTPDELAARRRWREIALAAGAPLDAETVKETKWTTEPETLYGRITNPRLRSVPIPVRLSNGAPGNRSCTADFKIKVISSWLYRRGARKSNPARVMLGISTDEFQRMNQSRISYVVNEYPLIERRMSRQDCMNTIARAGLAIPQKSSCFFCPYHRLSVWREMRDKQPELFAKSVELEQFINDRRERIGQAGQVWLSGALKPLDKAVGDASQLSLFEDDACESGYCMV